MLSVGLLQAALLRPDSRGRRVAGATKTGVNAGALAPSDRLGILGCRLHTLGRYLDKDKLQNKNGG